MSALNEFKNRLSNEWLIPFCSERGFSHEGFDGKSIDNLSLADAQDFMHAIDSGLVIHDKGIFTSGCSKANEQIFGEGARSSVPRKVTLWLEPIITIAGLMRLHRDFGWDAKRLGMQSHTWAFDLVGYKEDLTTEILVCEVKKTEREVDNLLELMEMHASTSAEAESEFTGTERNALKKVLALRQSKCSLFWALGPNHYGQVFKVQRGDADSLRLHQTSELALSFLATETKSETSL